MSISAASPTATAALPVTDPLTEPASIRNGGQAAKNAYATGLGFEQMLVGELTQQMTATISGTGSDSDGLGGTTDDGSGLGGASSDPAASAYSSLLPQALSSGLMSSGGTGIAMQIAQSLDPALASGAAAAAGTASATADTAMPQPASTDGGAQL